MVKDETLDKDRRIWEVGTSAQVNDNYFDLHYSMNNSLISKQHFKRLIIAFEIGYDKIKNICMYKKGDFFPKRHSSQVFGLK